MEILFEMLWLGSTLKMEGFWISSLILISSTIMEASFLTPAALFMMILAAKFMIYMPNSF